MKRGAKRKVPRGGGAPCGTSVDRQNGPRWCGSVARNRNACPSSGEEGFQKNYTLPARTTIHQYYVFRPSFFAGSGPCSPGAALSAVGAVRRAALPIFSSSCSLTLSFVPLSCRCGSVASVRCPAVVRWEARLPGHKGVAAGCCFTLSSTGRSLREWCPASTRAVGRLPFTLPEPEGRCIPPVTVRHSPIAAVTNSSSP